MASANVQLIQTDLDDKSLEHYLAQDIIAVDCEMMGLNINRDRLCLVQIGDKDNNVILLQIDQGQTSAPNLKKLLEDTSTLKLFHYARSDLAWLSKWLGITVAPTFCTKVASRLARTYTDKHSLKELTKEVTGKDLSKQQQSSDWGDSELNKDQQKYAAHDVYYLIKIYHKLRAMLEREGKWDLALKCIEMIPVFVETDIAGYGNIMDH